MITSRACSFFALARAISILTGPQWACPQTAKETRKPTQRRLGGWAPTEAIAQKKPFRLFPGEKWEEKQAFVLAPWETPIPCFIENQEAALKTHNALYEDTRCDQQDQASMLFIDGSGFAGHIGASMVSLQQGVSSQRRYLGTDSQSTVYAAELSGIEMALAKAKKEQAREVVIFSDSQAAIQAVQNPKRPSGQYILTRIYDHLRAIRSRNQVQQEPTIVTIRWIPAHVGVSGNEYADTEAKGAALLGAGIGATTGSGDPGRPTIRLAAAAKRAVRQRVRERWERQWERETTSAPTKRLVQAPNKKTLRLYVGLSKPQATRYVVNFMHQTGLLQQFRHARIEDDDEPVGLTAMDLGVEDDGY
ncbi:hypothetical protein PDIDSM_2470 [Penicillium digitatum]|nr:hypothetical protein PDIDSM_2470 [Penicillium digitatum]